MGRKKKKTLLCTHLGPSDSTAVFFVLSREVGQAAIKLQVTTGLCTEWATGHNLDGFAAPKIYNECQNSNHEIAPRFDPLTVLYNMYHRISLFFCGFSQLCAKLTGAHSRCWKPETRHGWRCHLIRVPNTSSVWR